MDASMRNIAILLATAAMAGCGGGTGGGISTPGGNQSPASTGGGVDIKIGNTEVKVNKDKGTNIKAGGVQVQAGGGADGLKLPADFPKDVPIYSGAIIKANLLASQGEQTTGMLHMQIPAPVDKVSEYYRAELKSQGWTESQYLVSQANGKTGTVIGAKKGSRTLAVTVTTDKEDVTIVNLTIAGE